MPPGEPAASLGSPRARAHVHGGRKRADWGAKDYRTTLPKILTDAQLALRQTGHFGRTGQDLVFFHADGQALFKAVIGRETERRVRLVTFYESDQDDMAAAESSSGTAAGSERCRDFLVKAPLPAGGWISA